MGKKNEDQIVAILSNKQTPKNQWKKKNIGENIQIIRGEAAAACIY